MGVKIFRLAFILGAIASVSGFPNDQLSAGSSSSPAENDSSSSLQSSPSADTTMSPADNATTTDAATSSAPNDITTILPPSCKELLKAGCEECTKVAECVYLISNMTGFSICQDSDADLPVVPEANWRIFHNTSECSG